MKKISVKNLSCVFIFTIVLSLVMISGSFAADASDLANVSSTDDISVVDTITDSGDESIVEEIANSGDTSVVDTMVGSDESSSVEDLPSSSDSSVSNYVSEDDSVNEVADNSNLGSLNEVSSYSSNDNEISSDDVSVFTYSTHTVGSADNLANVIAMAMPGDVIQLNSGYYNNPNVNTNLVISKDLSFVALDDGVIFDGNHMNNIFNINNDASVVFEGISFINGKSRSNGGAINVLDFGTYLGYFQNLTIINCNFADNTAASYGGAVRSGTYYNLNIVNSSFINNTANIGGAIDLSPNTPENINEESNIVSSIFENNVATNGGAIYVNHANLNLIYNYVCRNNANFGGAFYFNQLKIEALNLNKINVSNNVIVDNNYQIGSIGSDILYCFNTTTPWFNQIYDVLDLNNNWWGINDPMSTSFNDFTVYNENYYGLSQYWTSWSNRVFLNYGSIIDKNNSYGLFNLTNYYNWDGYSLGSYNFSSLENKYKYVKDFMDVNLSDDFCIRYQALINDLIARSNLDSYTINFTDIFKEKLIIYYDVLNLEKKFTELVLNSSGSVEKTYLNTTLTNASMDYDLHYIPLYHDTLANTLNYQTIFIPIISKINITANKFYYFDDYLSFKYNVSDSRTSPILEAPIISSLFRYDDLTNKWILVDMIGSNDGFINFNKEYPVGRYAITVNFFKNYTIDNQAYSNYYTVSGNSTKYSDTNLFDLIFSILPYQTNVSISTNHPDYFTGNIVHVNGTLNYYNDTKEFHPFENASLVLNLMNNGDFAKNVSLVTGVNGTYSYDFVDLVEGNYTIFVSFPGTENFTRSSANTTFKVSNTQSNLSISTSKDNYTSIEPVILNGTLTNVNTTEVIGLANITITVIDSNNKTIAVVNTTTDVNGNYNYTFDNLTNGTYTVLVNYPGNSSVIGSNVTTTLNISKVNSTINATTDKPSYLPNESVKLNGTLRDPNGNIIPNVTVTITLKNELNETIATVNVTTDDNANYYYDFGNLTNGTYIVDTVFDGNGYFLPSNSTIVFNVSLTTNGTNSTTNGTNSTNSTNSTPNITDPNGPNYPNSSNPINDPNLNHADFNSAILNSNNYDGFNSLNNGAVANSVSAASYSSSVNGDSESGLGMKSTGNPLAMLLLALLAIPFGLRRKL